MNDGSNTPAFELGTDRLDDKPNPKGTFEFHTYVFEPESDDDETSIPRTLQMTEDFDGQLAWGTGAMVWNAGIMLGKYLEQPKWRNSLAGNVWVELGAGTGLAGLVAASLGARVALTDCKNVLPLLQKNMLDNRGEFASMPVALGLDWVEVWQASATGRESDAVAALRSVGLWPVSGLLVSDCTWLVENLDPLIETLLTLSSGPAGHTCELILTHEDRNPPQDERTFAILMHRLGLRRVTLDELHPDWRYDFISVFHGTLHSRRLPDDVGNVQGISAKSDRARSRSRDRRQQGKQGSGAGI